MTSPRQLDRATAEDGFNPLVIEGFVDALVEALEPHARFDGARRIACPGQRFIARSPQRSRGRLGNGGRLRS